MARLANDPDSSDSVDIAMSRARGSDQAKWLLERQARLIDAHETLAHADLRHRGWQIVSERVGAGLKGLTALAGILVLVGVGSFLWSASRASGMVVDAFSVPPSFEQQGMTGTVVATQLLDKVAALEAGAQSARAKTSYEDSWSDTKGVVVPYAGVSLGQIRREMRDWLGSETHLGGDMVRLPGDRLAISFRTTSGLSGRVEGPAAEPDKLLEAAAMAMFKATQPYRYSVYQSRQGNRAEAVATLQALSRSDNLRDRLWAMHGLALSAPTQAEAVAIYKRVLELDPNFLSAVGNMPGFALNDGREEEALKGFERSAEAYAKGAEDYTRSYATGFGLVSRSYIAWLKGDLVESALQAEAAERTQSGGPTFLASRPFATAEAWADAHDFARARETLAAAGFLDPTRRRAAEKIAGAQVELADLHAIAADDDSGVVVALQHRLAALRGETLSNVSLGEAREPGVEEGRLKRLMAVPLARLGRIDEARAALAGQPGRHDLVIRARAFVAAYAGDHRNSDALFAQAAASTLSLPAANLLWAETLLHRGDAVRAERQAREAIRRGPNSAAAHRLLGDALNAQREWVEAERAYAAAARLSPQWGSLHMRWAAALWRLGQRDAARDKLRSAASMALSDHDRRYLLNMWNNASRA